MAWIHIVPLDRAEGLLRKLYTDAIQRAGKVFQINALQSLLPRILRTSTQLYVEVMFQPRNTITRAQREMIAAAVSQVNDCYY